MKAVPINSCSLLSIFCSQWPEIDPTLLEELRGMLPSFPTDLMPLRAWLTNTATSAGAPIDYVAQALFAAASGGAGGGAGHIELAGAACPLATRRRPRFQRMDPGPGFHTSRAGNGRGGDAGDRRRRCPNPQDRRGRCSPCPGRLAMARRSRRLVHLSQGGGRPQAASVAAILVGRLQRARSAARELAVSILGAVQPEQLGRSSRMPRTLPRGTSMRGRISRLIARSSAVRRPTTARRSADCAGSRARRAPSAIPWCCWSMSAD